MDEDLYTIPELIERLEEIKDNKEGYLNYPKAFMTLANAIQKIDHILLQMSLDD